MKFTKLSVENLINKKFEDENAHSLSLIFCWYSHIHGILCKEAEAIGFICLSKKAVSSNNAVGDRIGAVWH